VLTLSGCARQTGREKAAAGLSDLIHLSPNLQNSTCTENTTHQSSPAMAEGRAERRASRLLARALTHRPVSPPAAGAGRALRRRGGTPVRSSERGGVRPRTALAEQGDLPSDYAMGRWAAPPRLARLALRGLILSAELTHVRHEERHSTAQSLAGGLIGHVTRANWLLEFSHSTRNCRSKVARGCRARAAAEGQPVVA
jgi:hypothetical protein